MDTMKSWIGNSEARKDLELSVLVLEASLESLVLPDSMIFLTRTLASLLVDTTRPSKPDWTSDMHIASTKYKTMSPVPIPLLLLFHPTVST